MQSTIDESLIASLKTETDAFDLSIASIENRLGANGNTIKVIPGIEISNVDSISLDADWNLSDWTAGTLTIRSQGNVTLNNRISDGFANITGNELLSDADSWSYNVVAGADLDSAYSLQTLNTLLLNCSRMRFVEI